MRNRAGLVGERAFLRLARQNRWRVRDVRDNPEFRRRDIDFVVEGWTVEVKTDFVASSSGKIPFELFADVWRGKLGWGIYCEADYLFWYFPFENEFLQLKMSDFRRFCLKNAQSFEARLMGDRAFGLLVPLELIKSQRWCRLWSLKPRKT